MTSFLPMFTYKTTDNRCRGPAGCSNQVVISVACTCDHSLLYIILSLTATRTSATENQLQKPCMTSFLPIFTCKTTENRCRGPTGCSNQNVFSVPCTCDHSRPYIILSLTATRTSATENQLQKPCIASFLPIFTLSHRKTMSRANRM